MARQKIILRTPCHRLFRQIFLNVSAEDQNWDVRSGGEQLLERPDTLAVGERQLQQDGVDSSLAQAFKSIGKSLDPFHIKRTTVSRGQCRVNRCGSNRIMFNHKYFGAHRTSPWHAA